LIFNKEFNDLVYCNIQKKIKFRQPTTDNRQPTTDNRQPTTDNRQPTTDNAVK